MDENTKGNYQGSRGSNREERSQQESTVGSGLVRKAMGSTPKSTVGWGAVGACILGMLSLLAKVNSTIDDRIDKKIDPFKSVTEEKFRTTSSSLEDHEKRLRDLKSEVDSFPKNTRYK